MESTTPEVIELRCAENPQRMFAKLLRSDEVVISGNLMEFKCRDCARGRPGVVVLHRFNIAGDLVETVEASS